MHFIEGQLRRLHGLRAVIGRDVGWPGPLLEVPVIKDIINGACRPDARERRLIHTRVHAGAYHGTYVVRSRRDDGRKP